MGKQRNAKYQDFHSSQNVQLRPSAKQNRIIGGFDIYNGFLLLSLNEWHQHNDNKSLSSNHILIEQICYTHEHEYVLGSAGYFNGHITLS